MIKRGWWRYIAPGLWLSFPTTLKERKIHRKSDTLTRGWKKSSRIHTALLHIKMTSCKSPSKLPDTHGWKLTNCAERWERKSLLKWPLKKNGSCAGVSATI